MKYPEGVEAPVFKLKELKKVKLPISNYECLRKTCFHGKIVLWNNFVYL